MTDDMKPFEDTLSQMVLDSTRASMARMGAASIGRMMIATGGERADVLCAALAYGFEPSGAGMWSYGTIG